MFCDQLYTTTASRGNPRQPGAHVVPFVLKVGAAAGFALGALPGAGLAVPPAVALLLPSLAPLLGLQQLHYLLHICPLQSLPPQLHIPSSVAMVMSIYALTVGHGTKPACRKGRIFGRTASSEQFAAHPVVTATSHNFPASVGAKSRSVAATVPCSWEKLPGMNTGLQGVKSG